MPLAVREGKLGKSTAMRVALTGGPDPGSRPVKHPSDAGNKAMDLPASRTTSPDHLDEFARFLRDASLEVGRVSQARTLKAWLDLAEAYRITQALRDCHGNRSAAARSLGIGRRTLYAKMDKLGITATWRIAS
jgi:DNA-binding NtrC family response regulator